MRSLLEYDVMDMWAGRISRRVRVRTRAVEEAINGKAEIEWRGQPGTEAPESEVRHEPTGSVLSPNEPRTVRRTSDDVP